MTLEDYDANDARELFRTLGMEPMEGSNNRRGEFWIAKDGTPFFVPYGRRPQYTFVKEVVLDIFNEVVS